MNIGKKIIAYMVCLAMMVSMLPMSVVRAAEGETFEVSVEYVTGQNDAVGTSGVTEPLVAYGGTAEFTATPAEGYQVEGWYRDAEGKEALSGEGIEINEAKTICKIVGIKSATTVYVKFEKKTYEVSVEHVTGQDDSVGTSGVTEPPVAYGGTAEFTATPAEGYQVEGWYRDAEGKEALSGEGIEINEAKTICKIVGIKSATTVYVKFEKKTYEVSVEHVTGQDDAVGTSGVTEPLVAYGGTAEFTATPAEGYQVEGWYRDAEGKEALSGEGIEINEAKTICKIVGIKSATTVYVKFEKKTYEVSVEHVTGQDDAVGTSDVTETPVAYGGTAEFTATPAEGYQVEGWYRDAEGKEALSGEGIEINEAKTICKIVGIKSATTVYVKFEKKTYEVSVEHVTGQDDSVGTSGVTEPLVAYGGTAEFTATPAEGYQVEGWYRDAEGKEALSGEGIEINEAKTTCTITGISSATTVYVKFEKKTYEVSVEYVTGQDDTAGKVGVTETPVEYGGTAEFTATPAEGYCVEGWYVDEAGNQALILGNDVEINDDKTGCKIKNIQSEIKVYVKFIKHRYGNPEWEWTTTEEGYSVTAIFTCSNCPEGVAGNVVRTSAEVISTVTEPTCTESGKTVYTAKVTFDGKEYEDTKEVIIAATGHKLTATAAKAATCTESGNTAYYTCKVCGKYFSDAAGTKVIVKDSWIVKAKGHHIVEKEKKPTATKEGSLTRSCNVCGHVEEKLALPKKTLTIELGKSDTLISDASNCKITLGNAKKYEKYFSIDEKTGKITTKKNYSSKISKSIPIKVKTGGKTYKVTVKIKIPAPVIKIKRDPLGGTRYRYTFNYNVKKKGGTKIKVRSNLKGMNTQVVDRYLSKPISDDESYINLDLRKMKKVKFTIVAYYGKNVSEKRVILK